MLPAQRQAKLLEHLRRERFGSLHDLAAVVGASVSTTRRDIDYLCQVGHLDRTHGGAALRDDARATVEDPPELAREIARTVKERIGERAARRVEPRQTVLLDSGTTTAAVALALKARDIALTVFTNDVAIAAALSRSPIEVQVLGGTLRPGSTTILGAACLRAISCLRVDFAFVGAHAVASSGATETSIEHAEIKRSMIAAAAQSVLVADSGKFGSRSLCQFADLEDFAAVVCDRDLPAEFASDARARGIPIEFVEHP